MSSYEVWCPSCQVTFSPGTKRCVHCGGRTTAERGAAIGALRELAVVPAFSEEIVVTSADPPGPLEEEAPRTRSFLRAGMSVMWLVVLGAMYLWRACASP